MKRLLTAAVGIPLVLLGVFRLSDRWFFWVLAIALAPAVIEFVRMIRHWAPGLGVAPVLLAVTGLACLLVPAGSGLADGVLEFGAMPGAALLLLAAGGLALRPRIAASSSLPALGGLAFGALYFATPWASLYLLRHHGPLWVLLLLATVWLGDSAAYYAGRAFGRRKLAPVVSPNKTWEGAIAGTIAAVLGAAVWSGWQAGRVEPAILVWVLATSIAAQAGDLVESKMKRGAGIKDSGNLLPGHGGMLDRIDSLLFAAPVLAVAVDRFGLSALVR